MPPALWCSAPPFHERVPPNTGQCCSEIGVWGLVLTMFPSPGVGP